MQREFINKLIVIGSLSFMTMLFEVLLTRIFSIVLFGPQADLAVSLGILGIGIGAVYCFLYSSESPIEEHRLKFIPAALGALIFFVVWLTLELPLTKQDAVPPETFQERSHLLYNVVDTKYVILMIVILLVPFALSGFGISYVLKASREKVAKAYGIDLACGAIGAALGYFCLSLLATPDVAILCTFIGALSSLVLYFDKKNIFPRNNIITGVFVLLLFFSLYVLFTSRTDSGVLRIKYASGYSERTIVHSEWSPLSRVAVHRSLKTGQESIVLDNASASPIVKEESQVMTIRRSVPRGLVYRLVPQCRSVAIIGASAGSEVAVASHYQCKDIKAIDIVGKIFEVVQKRHSDPLNPYRSTNVDMVGLDGRTAVAVSPQKFDVIQMVHANLWSTSGVISNAWSHSLLETEEAFEMYLNKIDIDGIISFGRGAETPRILDAALRAVQQRDPDHYRQYALTVGGNGHVMLLRPRPWTPEEVDRVQTLLNRKEFGRAQIVYNPLGETGKNFTFQFRRLTDDRPFSDSPVVWKNFINWLLGKGSMFSHISIEQASFAFVYSIMVVQFGIILILGAILLFVPILLNRLKTNSERITGASPFLLFGFFVGYAFMAIEIVFLNKAMLYLGDPPYTAAIILCAFMLGSGIGAMTLTKNSLCLRYPWLPSLLILPVSVLTFQVLVGLPELIAEPSFIIRGIVVFVLVMPLAFLMGQPFSYIMSRINEQKSLLTPWVFAINTWSSVLAGFGTTIIARFMGFQFAGIAGLAAYGICGIIIMVLQRTKPSENEINAF